MSTSIWPKGARTAVSFTYDDGRGSQINIAAPDLEAAGFRGTFFVTPKLYNVEGRAVDWSWMARVGHEIGNHSFTHSLNYPMPVDFERAEVANCEQWLNDHVVFDSERTFAYPGGGTTLDNGIDYVDILQGVVLAARVAGGDPTTAKAAKLDPLRIGARATTWGCNSADATIAYIAKASTLVGGWCNLVFHDVVEGEPANESHTSRKLHREIIQHVSNSEEYWVAPFRNVYRHAVAYA